MTVPRIGERVGREEDEDDEDVDYEPKLKSSRSSYARMEPGDIIDNLARQLWILKTTRATIWTTSEITT
ncbi:hypothetical protein ColKHC_14338 [Colletotrichum higginsianum]|nr:hypothetical protein ColKHC_14338 [Colletotrichum higginsianum]